MPSHTQPTYPMRYIKTLPALALGFILFSGSASAQTANQSVGVTVDAISEIATSGPVAITITEPSAGSSADPVDDSSTTYDVSTNAASVSITALLQDPLETGLSLAVALDDPGTGTSTGSQALSDVTPATLVTGVTPVASQGNTITYTAGAAITLAPATYNHTVVFTITEE